MLGLLAPALLRGQIAPEAPHLSRLVASIAPGGRPISEVFEK
jgi:hypothetical protein